MTLYFCRHGRQNLRELKIKDFSFTKVDKGARYVAKNGDELTKNRREDDEGFEGEMMFQKIPRTSSCSKGQRKEVKLALTVLF